jgi:hypothetical protein
MIFLVAALVSFVKRSRSITLFDDVRGGSIADIANLSWQEFEALVGERFRHRGFQVTPRGGAGPDGGVDLALARGHERFLVQCKQWRAQQVGVSVVRELYGIMAAERVAGGCVVRMKHLNYAFVLGVMVVAHPASATTPVFRCQKDGQTILTDRPCDSPPSGDMVSTTSPNGEVTKSISALPTVVGDWRG